MIRGGDKSSFYGCALIDYQDKICAISQLHLVEWFIWSRLAHRHETDQGTIWKIQLDWAEYFIKIGSVGPNFGLNPIYELVGLQD